MDDNQTQRVLVIVAHPDDPEFFCGATLAKWAREGKDIRYLLLNCGDKGSDDLTMTPDAISAVRQAEQCVAARVIGVKDVIFLHHRDGELVNTLDLRREIVREIRRFKPQIVVTSDPTTYFQVSAYINHVDHRSAGAAVLEAISPAAGGQRFYPELLAEGLKPHSPREVWVTLTNEPNQVVNVTDTIDIKIAALLQHKSQIKESPEELAKRIKGKSRRPFWRVYREWFRVIRFW